MSLVRKCVWYVSKYVAPPTQSSIGGRGYLLMRELARKGHQSVVIASDANQLAEVPVLNAPYLLQHFDGVQFWWVRTRKFSVAKSLPRILSMLSFEWRLFLMPKKSLPAPNAIVVSSLSLLTILNGLLLSRKFRCRLIFEIRDIWPLTLTEEGGFGRHNPFILALGYVERLGYRRADAVVGTMPNLKEHVTNVIGHEKDVFCVPMGVEQVAQDSANLVSADYEAQYLPADKFIVAYVGTIGITNALDTLFTCAEILADAADIHFVVVGAGDLRSHYQDKYGHLGNLTFAPRVSKNCVQSVLVKCDLLYFSVHESAVWRYGQSLNKLIDYMQAGKPIVASYTGYPSMVNEAECGSFVPAGDVNALRDEIVRYSRLSEDERSVIGARGKEWLLENRSYAKLADDYLDVLFPD